MKNHGLHGLVKPGSTADEPAEVPDFRGMGETPTFNRAQTLRNHTAKNLYVKALIRSSKSLFNYARLKVLSMDHIIREQRCCGLLA